MKTKCFDDGVVQTFVDGELGSERVEELVRHLSICEECTLLAAELESENELAFGALDGALNTLVPTERLRSKVFASIQEIEAGESVGFWSRIVAGFGLTGLAARPGIAVFASILLFVAFAAIGMRYMDISSPAGGDDIAEARQQGPAEIVITDNSPIISPTDNDSVAPTDVPIDSGVPNNDATRPIVAMKAVHRVQPKRKPVRRINRIGRNVATARPAPPSPELDAEDGYLRTIATLNRTVDENKDYVLRPSERVTFERDLAVVNDAIKKMKGEVRQNPRNSAAREVLRSSYKNKIDLLNSVVERSERSETVASLD